VYGSVRTSLLDRAAHTARRLAGTARLFVVLATEHRSWGLTDLYAAAMTARFIAAHRLIDQAEAACTDDDTDLIQIRQPLWFGGTTITEDNQ